MPAALKALEAAGHPVLRLTTRIADLGAEFFRWEFATAVAGAVLRINPFDEPNVAEAKEKTKALLSAYASNGRLPQPAAAAEDDSVAVFSKKFSGKSRYGLLGSIQYGSYNVKRYNVGRFGVYSN